MAYSRNFHRATICAYLVMFKTLHSILVSAGLSFFLQYYGKISAARRLFVTLFSNRLREGSTIFLFVGLRNFAEPVRSANYIYYIYIFK